MLRIPWTKHISNEEFCGKERIKGPYTYIRKKKQTSIFMRIESLENLTLTGTTKDKRSREK